MKTGEMFLDAKLLVGHNREEAVRHQMGRVREADRLVQATGRRSAAAKRRWVWARLVLAVQLAELREVYGAHGEWGPVLDALGVDHQRGPDLLVVGQFLTAARAEGKQRHAIDFIGFPYDYLDRCVDEGWLEVLPEPGEKDVLEYRPDRDGLYEWLPAKGLSWSAVVKSVTAWNRKQERKERKRAEKSRKSANIQSGSPSNQSVSPPEPAPWWEARPEEHVAVSCRNASGADLVPGGLPPEELRSTPAGRLLATTIQWDESWRPPTLAESAARVLAAEFGAELDRCDARLEVAVRVLARAHRGAES